MKIFQTKISRHTVTWAICLYLVTTPLSKIPAKSSYNPADPTLCPAKVTIQDACTAHRFTAAELTTKRNQFTISEKALVAQDRCRLWWWASEVHKWNYPPLTEWAENLQDVLMERKDLKETGVILGVSPEAPLPRLDSGVEPVSSCQYASESHGNELAQDLKTLDFRKINPRVLHDMVEHCLAFEVASSLGKRMMGSVIESYVMPIGDINFVILGELKFQPVPTIEAGVAGALPKDSISYRTVGTCEVSQNPKECVEGMIRTGGAEIFPGEDSFRHKVKVAPDRTDVDGLLANRWPGTREVEIGIDPEGHLSFFPIWTKGEAPENWKPGTFQIAVNDGHFALVTEEKQCSKYYLLRPEKLYLRLLAYGETLDKLYTMAQSFEPTDFPAPNNGPPIVVPIEKGCPTQTPYSAWAAETANLALHMVNHMMPFDNLYRATAAERRKWRISGDRLGRMNSNVTSGEWRIAPEESAILPSDPHELQAIQYVLGSRKLDSDILSRQNDIDGTEATEIWYYNKPQPVALGEKDVAKSHIVIHHLKDFNEIYASSVIARLVKVSSRCAAISLQKKEFLTSMYALFNAVPLQAADGTVGKIFMAATYQQIFGQKIPKPQELVDIDIDALTMNRDDFTKHYLPLM